MQARRTRRLASLAATAAAALVLASCSGGGDEQNASSTGNPDPSIPITYAWPATPGQWDPHKSANQNAESTYLYLVYDRLLYLETDDKLSPMLATAWKFSADGLTLDLTIREGVKFHDGQMLDATAVVTNLERARTETTTAAQLSVVESVSAPDAKTVQIKLKQPKYGLLYTLASPTGSIISPAAINDPSLAQKPVGAGPYTLKSVDSITATFERFPDYWDKDFVGSDVKMVSGVRDAEATINGLRTGEIDAALWKLDQLPSVEEMVASGEFVDARYDSKAQSILYINTKGVLANEQARLGINLAIDRDAINKAAMQGGCPPVSQAFNDGIPGSNPSLAPYGFDPARARQLLSAAGVTRLTLLQMSLEPQATIAQIVQQQLKDVGVEVDLVPVDSDNSRPTWRQGKADLWMHNISLPSPDAESLINLVYTGGENLGTIPPELAKAADEVRLSPVDSPEREAALSRLDQYVYDHPVHAPICALQGLVVARKGVQHVDDLNNMRSGTTPDIRHLIAVN